MIAESITIGKLKVLKFKARRNRAPHEAPSVLLLTLQGGRTL